MKIIKEEMKKQGKDKVKHLKYQRPPNLLKLSNNKTDRENEDLESLNPLTEIHE